MSGTSMAAPFVSGIAALILAVDPSRTPAEIKTIIESTSDDKGDSGYDQMYGYGRVNVGAAVAAASGTSNNYGTRKVTITSGSSPAIPVTNTEVQLIDSTGTTLLHATLTSLGGIGGTAGVAQFSLVPSGSYQVLAYFGSTKTANVTVAAGSTTNAALTW
jgi:subtilisin family serine protease